LDNCIFARGLRAIVMTELLVVPQPVNAGAGGLLMPQVAQPAAPGGDVASGSTPLNGAAVGRALSDLPTTSQTDVGPNVEARTVPSARTTSSEANEEVELQPTEVFKRQHSASASQDAGRWFVYQESGTHLGPVDVDTLARGVATGKIPPDAHVARQGDAVWVLVDTLPAVSAAQLAAKGGADMPIPALVAVPKAPAPPPEAKPKLSPESTAVIFTAADLEAALELVDADSTPVPGVPAIAAAPPPQLASTAPPRASRRPPPPTKSLSAALRVQASERAPLTAPEPPTLRALNAESARQHAASVTGGPGGALASLVRPPSVRPISTKPAGPAPAGALQLTPPPPPVAPDANAPPHAVATSPSAHRHTLLGSPEFAAAVTPFVPPNDAISADTSTTAAAPVENALARHAPAAVDVASVVTAQQFKAPYAEPAAKQAPPPDTLSLLSPHESNSTLVMAPSSPPSAARIVPAAFAATVGTATMLHGVSAGPAYPQNAPESMLVAAVAAGAPVVVAPPTPAVTAAPWPAWIPLVTFGVFAALALIVALVMMFTSK
jgi:GYF domain 2